MHDMKIANQRQQKDMLRNMHDMKTISLVKAGDNLGDKEKESLD